MLLLLLSTALATPPPTPLGDTLAQLIPELEAHTRRPFLHPPQVEAVTREQLRERLTTEQRRLNQLLRTPQDDASVAAQLRPFVQHAAGVYTYGDRIIYVVEEAIEEILVSSGAPERMRGPVLRCVMAHELVHVLQHQYQPMPTTHDPEQTLMARALREGHAELLSEDFCAQQQAGALVNAHRGLDVLASHGQRTDEENVALLYGYSTRYVRAAQAQHGTEATWWMLSEPPPSRSTLLQVGRAGLLTGWQDPQALIAPLHLETGPEWQIEAGPTSPLHVLRPLQPKAGWPEQAPQPLAGLLYTTFRSLATQQSVTVLAIALQDPAQATQALKLRRQALSQEQNQRELILMGSVSQYKPNYKLRSIRRPAARRPPDDSLVLHLRSPGDYHEQWVARDGLVLMAAARHPDVNAKQLTQLLMDLLDQEWPTVASVEPAPDLGLQPPDPLPPTTPSWEYPLLNLLVQQDARDWEGCIETVRQITPTAPPEALPTVANAGYHCALIADDVGVTDRMLDALGGAQHVDPLLRLSHATQRYLNGRHHDALSLVRDLADQDLELPPEQASQLEDLWLVLLADGGQLSEALRRVRRGQGQPDAQLHVAMRLLEQRREPEAMPLLRGLCPKVTGESAQACQEAMDYLTPEAAERSATIDCESHYH